MTTAAVILAAGLSSRMRKGVSGLSEGKNIFKPLMHVGEKSMLQHCLELFQHEKIAHIIVVTGYRNQEIEKEVRSLETLLPLSSCLHIIYNERYQEGMFTSICKAVQLLTTFADISGFFLLPVDMPLVRKRTVTTLLSAFDGTTVLYPSFAGHKGHPPLIPRKIFNTILSYSGENGLQGLLQSCSGREISVWDRGVLLDADTAADVAVLQQHAAMYSVASPREACILARMYMPERGLVHGMAVARVALSLTRALNRCQGQQSRQERCLDRIRVFNGALLHDIGKGREKQDLGHERRGGALACMWGLSGLSDIIALHSDITPSLNGEINEAMIVCLADKLVKGGRRVSIRQRFAEKRNLFADDAEACRVIQMRMERNLALQRYIETLTGLSIDEIVGAGG